MSEELTLASLLNRIEALEDEVKTLKNMRHKPRKSVSLPDIEQYQCLLTCVIARTNNFPSLLNSNIFENLLRLVTVLGNQCMCVRERSLYLRLGSTWVKATSDRWRALAEEMKGKLLENFRSFEATDTEAYMEALLRVLKFKLTQGQANALSKASKDSILGSSPS